MRSGRMILVLLIAVGLASLATYGVYTAIQRLPVREVEVHSRPVVVAARPLPVGTLLTPNDVRVAAWPESSQTPGSFEAVEAVVDRGLTASVVENEPILDAKLASREAGGGLPPSIPPGMRAISVKVNEVIGVAGFVVPGTRVDILVTVSRDGDSMTRAVVSNVEVLTAGTRYDQDAARAEGTPIPTTVVTLMVTPQDAERIALAASQGLVMLALRNPLDTMETDTTGIRLGALMAPPAPPPVARQVGRQRVMVAQPPPAPKIYTVEAIRAAERSQEVVR